MSVSVTKSLRTRRPFGRCHKCAHGAVVLMSILDDECKQIWHRICSRSAHCGNFLRKDRNGSVYVKVPVTHADRFAAATAFESPVVVEAPAAVEVPPAVEAPVAEAATAEGLFKAIDWEQQVPRVEKIESIDPKQRLDGSSVEGACSYLGSTGSESSLLSADPVEFCAEVARSVEAVDASWEWEEVSAEESGDEFNYEFEYDVMYD